MSHLFAPEIVSLAWYVFTNWFPGFKTRAFYIVFLHVYVRFSFFNHIAILFFVSVEPVTLTFNINDVMMQDNVYILLDCLNDSYESNKMMAFDILLATPPEQLPFQVCLKSA